MNDIMNRTLTLERTINAPRKLVWEAWTQAGHIASWWGPKGMETRVVELDFVAGGKWKYVMTAPNGSEFPTEGIFSEIIEFERIITTGEFGQLTSGVILDIRFQDAGENTKLTFSVIHPTQEYCKAQEEMGAMKGWGSTLDGLANYLASLAS